MIACSPDASLRPAGLSVTAQAVLASVEAQGDRPPIPGCTLAMQKDGRRSTAIAVDWSILNSVYGGLPRPDTTARSRALHVVRRKGHLENGLAHAVACAVPFAREYREAVARIARKGTHGWTILRELLGAAGVEREGLASDVARQMLRARRTARAPWDIAADRNRGLDRLLGGTGPAASLFGEWTDRWLGQEQGVPIGGVTLWGYQDSWSFDDIDWHEELSLFARLDLSQPSVFWQLYDYEHCAEATAYNIMLDEEADALEENADLIGRVLKYV